MTTCATCHGDLYGNSWAHTHTRLDTRGEYQRYVIETRYVCDDCEGE